jgi:uncharacterized LabA/DUF88 family protein
MIVHLYIDGDNLFYLQKDDLGWRLDFEKLLKFCKQFGDLERAAYYIGSYKDDTSEKKAFFARLVDFGYQIVSKPVKEVKLENGDMFHKSNLDMVMLRDICLNNPYYDLAIIVTGDGDFDCILEAFRAMGKKFKVISTRRFSASILKAIAGMDFIDFHDHREKLELSLDTGWLSEDDYGSKREKQDSEREKLSEASDGACQRCV